MPNDAAPIRTIDAIAQCRNLIRQSYLRVVMMRLRRICLGASRISRTHTPMFQAGKWVFRATFCRHAGATVLNLRRYEKSRKNTRIGAT